MLERLVGACGLELGHLLRQPRTKASAVDLDLQRAAERVARAGELSRILTGIALAAKSRR
jgi:hypothetical protein